MAGHRGLGAPKGNQNALKHGRFTREEIAHRRHLRDLLRKSDELLRELKSD
jgi:glucans biosynthesis protein